MNPSGPFYHPQSAPEIQHSQTVQYGQLNQFQNSQEIPTYQTQPPPVTYQKNPHNPSSPMPYYGQPDVQSIQSSVYYGPSSSGIPSSVHPGIPLMPRQQQEILTSNRPELFQETLASSHSFVYSLLHKVNYCKFFASLLIPLCVERRGT